jgi:hypothetical protein
VCCRLTIDNIADVQYCLITMNAPHTASRTASTVPPPSETPRCSCCKRPIDDETWHKLPFVGHMDDGDGGVLALKNCTCGSTLARAVWTPKAREWFR